MRAEFYPIELHATDDVLLSRVESIERKDSGKISSKEKLRELLPGYVPLKIKHKNKLSVDVKHDKIKVFEFIKNHIDER